MASAKSTYSGNCLQHRRTASGLQKSHPVILPMFVSRNSPESMSGNKAVTGSPTVSFFGFEVAVTLPLATPFETDCNVKSTELFGTSATEQSGQRLKSR